jgi:hypothetical protein
VTEDANFKTWTTDSGKTYPLFPFDEAPVVKLPNGTTHYFRRWDEVTEKKREDLMKTVILSSPAIINGENPRDVKTDFTRSAIAYYDMMIERVSGVSFNGNDPNDILDANQETGETLPNGKPARIRDLIGANVRRAAAVRIYGGKIELERPGAIDDDDDDFTGDPFDADDITKQVERQEKQREIYQLTLNRSLSVRHELGVEQISGTGRTTEPSHVIIYRFREPTGDEFSKWELKGYRGYSINLKNGGERSERFYNLETIRWLFDTLIEKIDGASINGNPIHLPDARDDVQRQALLAVIPLSVKKLTVATVFAEMSQVGNA